MLKGFQHTVGEDLCSVLFAVPTYVGRRTFFSGCVQLGVAKIDSFLSGCEDDRGGAPDPLRGRISEKPVEACVPGPYDTVHINEKQGVLLCARPALQSDVHSVADTNSFILLS